MSVVAGNLYESCDFTRYIDDKMLLVMRDGTALLEVVWLGRSSDSDEWSLSSVYGNGEHIDKESVCFTLKEIFATLIPALTNNDTQVSAK